MTVNFLIWISHSVSADTMGILGFFSPLSFFSPSLLTGWWLSPIAASIFLLLYLTCTTYKETPSLFSAITGFPAKRSLKSFLSVSRTLSRWLCVIHTVNYFTFLTVPSFSTKRILRIILQTLSFNSTMITLMVDKLQNVRGKSLWGVLNIIQEYFQVSWKTLVEFAKLFNNCPETCKYWLTVFFW